MKDLSSLRQMTDCNKVTSVELCSLINAQTQLISKYIISSDYMSSLDKALLIEDINDHNIAIQKRLVEMVGKQYGITDFFENELIKEKEKAESE